MDESDKRRFEAILSLYQRAHDQFNERRKYEVQVSFAFWTALVLAIAGSVNLAVFPDLPGGRVTLVFLGAAIVGVHALWHYGVWRSNRRDRARALDYQDALHSLASFSYTTATLDDLAGAQPGQKFLLSNSSHRFQLALTLLLAASLVLVNWRRFADSQQPEVEPGTSLRAARDSVALETERLRLYLLRLDSTRASLAPVRRRKR